MLWLVYFFCVCVCVFVSLVAYFYYTTPNIGVLYIYINNNYVPCKQSVVFYVLVHKAID